MMRSRRDITFVLYLVALTAVFGWSLAHFFAAALRIDLNSYIVLIPLVSIYFFFSNRSQFTDDRRCSVGWALLPSLAGGAALFFLMNASGDSLSPNDRNTIVALAFVCLVWAGGFLFLGRQ